MICRFQPIHLVYFMSGPECLSCCADTDIDSVFMLDPEALVWTDLTAAAAGGPTPVGRDRHGVAGAGGLLYVMGGYGGTGPPAAPQCIHFRLYLDARPASVSASPTRLLTHTQIPEWAHAPISRPPRAAQTKRTAALLRSRPAAAHPPSAS
jgi:hypothetical protein